MPKEYGFPVYGTQGGGLAQRSGNDYYFVEAPGHSGLNNGDKVPSEWGIVPANAAARQDDDDQRLFNAGVDELFGVLLDLRASGKVSNAEAEAFFPDEVKNRN